MSVLSIKKFKVGQIYKMKAAKRSHVLFPYYVWIKEVGDDYIVTDIPAEHSLKITVGTYEWRYHTPRMKLVGNVDDKARVKYFNVGVTNAA